jgi:Tfp pilus assembly pilus retraction ATPase PilT
MTMNELLELSVKMRASDLHILPSLTPQMRIDGNLGQVKDIGPLTAEKTRDMIYSILTKDQI